FGGGWREWWPPARCPPPRAWRGPAGGRPPGLRPGPRGWWRRRCRCPAPPCRARCRRCAAGWRAPWRGRRRSGCGWELCCGRRWPGLGWCRSWRVLQLSVFGLAAVGGLPVALDVLWQGQQGFDTGALARGAGHREGAAEHGYPLAHAVEAKARRRQLAVEAAACVPHIELKLALAQAQFHHHPAGVGVAGGVGDGFLDDAKGGGGQELGDLDIVGEVVVKLNGKGES